MTTVDLSKNRVQGGFFLNFDRQSTPYEWTADNNETYRFLGTYRASGSPIRDALLEMIRGAKQRIFLAAFMIGDEKIIAELLNAADRLRGGVYVITALDEKSLRKGLREYEEQEQEAPEHRKKNFERLTTGGVYVRGHESCHAKFMVADDTVAIVGSANFDPRGFDYSGEADLLVRDRLQVRQLACVFTELWYEGCSWEVAPGETYVVAERAGQEPPRRPEPPGGLANEIVWTNGPDNMSLLKSIHDVIAAATTQLFLSSYSIVGMQDNRSLLFDTVKQAVDRGVDVHLFLRQRNAYPKQMEDVLVAHDMGVTIHADIPNHAKVVIADDTQAVVFSANFDANHGLNSGVEVGVRLHDQGTVRQVRRYIEHAMDNANATFVRDPRLAWIPITVIGLRI